MACSSANDIKASAIKVEIKQLDGHYVLFRDDAPYLVNGAGYTEDDLALLKKHGGNSVRTWGTERAGGLPMEAFLDQAHSLGISVSLNLPVPAPRWGVDYGDEAFKSDLMAKMKDEVLKYKDHPALLTWFIGNELDHASNDYRVYDFVNDVSEMIHEIDPNHPTTTTLTGLNAEVLSEVNKRAPSLDFVSFQVYGQIHNLPEFIADQNYDKPIMITEWGAIGFWEMSQTAWEAPIEMTSTAKATNYYKSYQKIAAVEHLMIGNYVFLWGQKQERTPTWFGLFTDQGEKTEAIDVMHYIWTGEWPENRTPQVTALMLDGKTSNDNVTLTGEQRVQATVTVEDFEDDPLTFRWEVKRESKSTKKGGDFEKDIPNIEGAVGELNNNSVEIITPAEPGAYRLFVYVNDGKDHVGHANIPFYVTAPAAD